MDQEKGLRLLLRQIKDIQAQADKVIGGENSDEAIESFARYSMELKDYISKNVDSNEVKAYLTELPEINYTRTQIKLWQYLLFPAWWIELYKDYLERNKTVQEISIVRGKYSTLEILVKGLVN